MKGKGLRSSGINFVDKTLQHPEFTVQAIPSATYHAWPEKGVSSNLVLHNMTSFLQALGHARRDIFERVTKQVQT